MADNTATSRLARLLALVPYVLTHQGVSFAEASREFGISESQLKDDLNLIFVSGLPGYTPLELIDVVMDHDTIHIRNADVIAKPMRLAPDEALALLLGLQLLEPLAGEEVAALKEKISASSVTPVNEIAERLAVIDEVNPVGAIAQDALSKQRRLLLDYYVPSRDEVTQREVDPIRVEVLDGHTYLIAYCRVSEAIRHFRMDRVLSAKIVDRPAAPPTDADANGPLFATSSTANEVILHIAPTARWLIDHLMARVIDESTIAAPLAEPEFFVRLVLSMAGQVQILEPASLADQVRAKAQSALAVYSQK